MNKGIGSVINSQCILTVDRNLRNLELLGEFLAKAGYTTLRASGVAEIAQTLKGPEDIVLALVDISGFDRTIWEYCEQIKAKNIPLLVLSPKHNAAIQQESLAHGARGVLVKPLVVKELLGLIKSMTEE
jgi:CheY-like chemotaxis protein